jgi:hypothetical protein
MMQSSVHLSGSSIVIGSLLLMGSKLHGILIRAMAWGTEHLSPDSASASGGSLVPHTPVFFMSHVYEKRKQV